MARLHRDWYLEGWHREYCEVNGRRRTVWKYTGEYFRFALSPRGLARLKAAYPLLTLLMLGLWFYLSMLRVAGREMFFVGAEWFLCILPFMPLLLGAASFLTVPERMTYRAMYGSYKRCRYAGLVLLALLGLTAVGEIVFLCLYGAQVALLREILWLAGVLACLACDVAIVLLLRRYPPMLD